MNINIETKYELNDFVKFKYYKDHNDKETFTEHIGKIVEIIIETSNEETNLIYFVNYKINEEQYSCFCNELNVIEKLENYEQEEPVSSEDVGGTTTDEITHTEEQNT